MICKYSSTHDEIAIEGTKQDWLSFAKKVESGDVTIECEEVQPNPYDASAKEIIVRQCDGDVMFSEIESVGRVRLYGNAVVIGDLKNLLFSLVEDYRPNTHFHLDYIDKKTQKAGDLVLMML